MVKDKVKELKNLKKILEISASVFVLLQIVFIVIVLLVSLYLLMGLMNNHSFDFLTPFVQWAKSFIHFFFGNSIRSTQQDIDGEVVLYIFLNIFYVFLASQLKTACSQGVLILEKKIVVQRQEDEELFNKKLQEDINNDLRAQKLFLLILKLRVKNAVKGAIKADAIPQEEIDEINKKILGVFFAKVKDIPGLSFTKDGDILLISCANFEQIDEKLQLILKVLDDLKAEYKEKKLIILSRMAIDVYRSANNLKPVYTNLKPLLGLNSSNEILCYGNFNNRYKLIQNPKHLISIKGKFDFNGRNESVYGLIKKS